MWNGRVGVWSRELRFSPDRGAALDAAAELEQLGYGALWIPDVGGDVFGACEALLAATHSIPLLTGILNIWAHDAAAVAAGRTALDRRHPGRFTLGIGASPGSVVGERYGRPLSAMRTYLDALDAEGLEPGDRLLAALGPKMLELSRTRGAGAHPYLVPVEHTRQAREILGPDRRLGVEQGVVLARDRDAARAHVAAYLELPNYVANLRRLGNGDADFSVGARVGIAILAIARVVLALRFINRGAAQL